MSARVEFKTIEDALNFVNNSAVAGWPWGGGASGEGFARYLLENHANLNSEDYSEELKAYLKSVGEDPLEYGLM